MPSETKKSPWILCLVISVADLVISVADLLNLRAQDEYFGRNPVKH
jgi:hypothetical protein